MVPNLPVCHTNLILVFFKLRASSFAEYFCKKLNQFDVGFVQCLIEQNTKEKNDEAITICKELLAKADSLEHPEIITELTRYVLCRQ